MANALPSKSEVLAAIDLYMRHAYGQTAPPRPVRDLLQQLAESDDDIFASRAFAHCRSGGPEVHVLRLGNCAYPHMKFIIEPAPGGQSYIFRVDCHDEQLCLPQDHREFGSCARLREENRRVCSAIDQAWADAGIETFATFLRRDLDRRKSASKTV